MFKLIALAVPFLMPVVAFAADTQPPPAETDARLHADGNGWRLDKAAIADPARPRVLLIGDSILNGYLKQVSRSLEGKAYVDAWVNPHCQSEHLNKLLGEVLDQGPYDVVHFNMGLHGWQPGRIKPEAFEPLTQAYVEVIRRKLPKAKIIWAASTPVTVKGKPTELDPTINPIIVEHNRLAAKVMRELQVPINDFYGSLVDKLDLARGDQFHWTAPAYELLAKLAGDSIQGELAAGSASGAGDNVAGWVKYAHNPVLGGELGTCFDISVLKEGDIYRMWFSWRPKKSIALVESNDGVTWSKPTIVLGPNPETEWESDINRPIVIKRVDVQGNGAPGNDAPPGGGYQMWYTGQARGKSWIGLATSDDGKTWRRASRQPVLSAEAPWENVAVMCPHVIHDAEAKLYRMWYSGGEQYEPNAIGYATSPDGLAWTKHRDNPIFRPDPSLAWERERVTACQVLCQGDGYLMFYIGFRDRDHAQIGLAKSADGVSGWKRHPANPIIHPDPNAWDHDAVYKPYAIFDGRKWLLWYNGRHGSKEQIGLVTHEGEDLGF